jgi:hypothetical protein
MELFQFVLSLIVTGATFLLSLAGLYWKIQLDLAKIKSKAEADRKHFDLLIAEINCDRKERWNKHDEKQDKSDAYLSDILKIVSIVETKISSVETNIEWLKKDKK